MPSRHYSDYLTNICGLIGVPYSSMTSDEQGWLNVYFNANTKTMWSYTNWTDVCPWGEARFVGNALHYTNNIANTTYWTPTNTTITANSIANPSDGKVSACQVLETSATGNHNYTQSYTFVPGAGYTLSTYVRPIGGRYFYVAAYDGVTTYYSFFNLTTGAVMGNANCSTTPTCVQQGNGFWLVTIFFTSNASAGAGTVTFQTSSDGSTLSYAGDATKGVYVWGNLLQQTTYVSPQTFTLPYAQEGEDEMDVVYQVYRDNPANATYPRVQSYKPARTGLQMIAGIGFTGVYYGNSPSFVFPITNPVYVYYRKSPPTYTGVVYSANSTYAIGDQIQYSYTSSTTGATTIDYYACIVATTAGQNPITTPNSWSLIEVQDTFYLYTADAGFADWLRQDGQHDTAQLQDAIAQEVLEREGDTQERELRNIPPMIVTTHGTTQSRF